MSRNVDCNLKIHELIREKMQESGAHKNTHTNTQQIRKIPRSDECRVEESLNNEVKIS